MINIQTHKKAEYDFFKIVSYEAGIQLHGSEVKSIRNKSVNMKGSFCRFVKNELFLFNMQISTYEQSVFFNRVDELRVRKLLLKKRELNKLKKAVDTEGLTIIPYKLYFNDNGRCKMEIWLAKGKKNYDKRHYLKEKDISIKNNRLNLEK